MDSYLWLPKLLLRTLCPRTWVVWFSEFYNFVSLSLFQSFWRHPLLFKSCLGNCSVISGLILLCKGFRLDLSSDWAEMYRASYKDVCPSHCKPLKWSRYNKNLARLKEFKESVINLWRILLSVWGVQRNTVTLFEAHLWYNSRKAKSPI